ncbi:MAG: hypothetical protein BGO69_12605 [Bacteroidetes bacterium 46-16]|uniref:Uncharacterized protein n=1 Tax=Taibaiella soli TaxID=1649169 RepID=A0A2W2B5S6_9BACT|nr:hypothetical protein [Taibaiella soli]OJW79564.1 MAG: hypothetical protein BGO69_12605 [Bacteroidetes bacterium 46-16]PZF71559.1 hypothetical protein DN068_15910 [Taibaiella soli]
MINLEDYVERQMRRRGIEIAYARTLPVVVRRIADSTGTVLSNSIEFDAYNQFWFLANSFELPIGTRITSDTNVMLLEAHSSDIIEEFWGKIKIQLPNSFTGSLCQALFYQVLPK